MAKQLPAPDAPRAADWQPGLYALRRRRVTRDNILQNKKAALILQDCFFVHNNNR
jgi:hypothetical protein